MKVAKARLLALVQLLTREQASNSGMTTELLEFKALTEAIAIKQESVTTFLSVISTLHIKEVFCGFLSVFNPSHFLTKDSTLCPLLVDTT